MVEPSYQILVVDDSPEDRATYRRFLGEEGASRYVIRETESGEEGLRLCRLQAPDCILLDYRLPDLDGLEFLAELSAGQGEVPIPVVMLTGQGNEGVAVQAMKSGAQDYLIKGAITGQALRRAVHHAVEKVALRREIEEQRRQLEQLAQERAGLIAELRQRAEALAELDRRKDEFLAMLAHELRNPLAPIYNAVYLLRQTGPSGPAVGQILEMLERQVKHLNRLVDDLLDVSRITCGKIPLKMESVSLALVVDRAVEAHRPLLDKQRHRLTVELPPEPMALEADPTRLAQVLGNLLHNAAKYTEPGGQVWLTAVREGHQAVIRVRDTGIGISREMLPHVFDLFIQENRSLDRAQGGLGIGLTLVRSLVEMHGGTVQVDSPGRGLGSEFTLRLPLRGERSEGELRKGAARQAGHDKASARRRVLVVDDNLDLAQSLAILLNLWGYDTRMVHTGPDALTAASTYHPEIVLLDIGLPGLDGYQVARQLRLQRELHSVFLIALTGYGKEEDRRRSQEAGFDHHLVKPLEPQALQNLLGQFEAQNSDK